MTAFYRCYYLCCQGEDQEGCASEQGRKLQIQHKRGCEVRTQREVLGHLQEAWKLQEDEDLVRPVQHGHWRLLEGDQGKKQADVRLQRFFPLNKFDSQVPVEDWTFP